MKASESAGRSGFFLCFALTVGRRDIAGAPASTGLHRRFPAGPVWTECTAGASSLTAGCAFLLCRLTLTIGLGLGRILLGCVPVLFLPGVGLLFLPGIGLAGLRPAATVAGTSGHLGRSATNPADSASRSAKTFPGALEGSASRAFSYAGALANPGRRFSGQAQSAANPVCRPLCHHGQGGAEYGVGDYAGETGLVSSDGWIQADPGDNFVRLFRHLDDADDQHHPQEHVWKAGDSGHHRQQHFEKDDVGGHEKAHTAEHPAPAGENLRCALTATHSKSQRGHDGEHSQHHVPLCHLQQQGEHHEHGDKVEDDDQQPGGGKDTKDAAVHQLDMDGVRDIQQGNHFAGDTQNDFTDLRAGQQEEAKHKSPGEEQFGVLPLEAQPGGHAPQGLEHQVPQQQRPAYRQNDLLYVPHDGDVGLDVGKIQAHDVQQ